MDQYPLVTIFNFLLWIQAIFLASSLYMKIYKKFNEVNEQKNRFSLLGSWCNISSFNPLFAKQCLGGFDFLNLGYLVDRLVR